MNEDQFQEKNPLSQISFVDMVPKNRGITPEFLEIGKAYPGQPAVVEAESELFKSKHLEADRVLREQQAKLEQRRKELGIINKPLNRKRASNIIIPVKKSWCAENPYWEPKESVGIFNELLRTSVFTNPKKGVKVLNQDKPVMSWSKDISIRLSGPQMLQLDLGNYLAMRTFYKYDEKNPDNKYVFFSLDEITRRAGKSPVSGKNDKTFKTSVKRMLEATIYLYSEKEKTEIFGGHLINEFIYDPKLKKYRVELNINMIKLNKNGSTWLNVDTWNSLSQGLTRFLYGFLFTHQSSMKDLTIIKLESLLQRTESKTSLKDFKQKVLKAIKELKAKRLLFYAEVKGDLLIVAREEGSQHVLSTTDSG